MRRVLFLLSATTLLVTVTNAQSSVDIGFKAGLSIPDLTSGTSANPVNSGYSSRLGSDAALLAEFKFSKHFSIQPQLEYSEQGGKKNGIQAFDVPANIIQDFPAGTVPPYLYADYKNVAKIDYLMLPVLAKYRLDIGQHWGAYIGAGPFASMLLSARNITSGSSAIYLDKQQSQPFSSEPQSFDNDKNIKSDLHKFNTGISGQLGINYKLSKGNLFIEGGGNYGLVDIQKNVADGKNNTGAATFDLGYQFRLFPK